MLTDQRDEIWQVTFETYYNIYYNELIADVLINKWQKVDERTKMLIDITASGSAVSGLAFWAQPGFRTLWTIIAVFTAILSITHSRLNISGRLKDLGETKRVSIGLRTDLETFRQRMQIDPNFPVQEFTDMFIEYRKRYSDCLQQFRNVTLITKRLENQQQNRLNSLLQNQII